MATSSPKKAPPENITWHASKLSRSERWDSLSTSGATVWFTGLSGSGKSTLAAAVEAELVNSRRSAYRLDGDNLRTGLNADLDFTREGREENVRRVAEVSFLFADAGVVALVALISPYRSAREYARTIHEKAGIPFVEVHMTADVEICASRDPKGLYARANAGGIASFTGLDDPYEPPDAPELSLRPDVDIAISVDEVIRCLDSRTEAIRAS
ncbi:MAG: adenylyl-sulfate kinase [Acidimicrobiales bacterium]